MKEYEKLEIIGRLDAALATVPAETEPGSLDLMAETGLLALHTLEALESEAVCALSISDFISCRKDTFVFLLHQIDAFFEQAKTVPYQFAESLHVWCVELAEDVRAVKGGTNALAQLASMTQKLRYEYREEKDHVSFFTICLDLILHVLSRLEPSKSRSHFSIVGVDTNDDLLIASDHFANGHIAEWEMNTAYLRTGKHDIAPFLRYGCDTGFDDDAPSRDTVARFLRRRRIYDSARAALLPYIDAYTYDIFPKDMAYTDMGQFAMMHLELDEVALQQQLSTGRKYALAANGVTVAFEDSTGTLKKLLMKEIRVDDRICLLFKLVTAAGDFSGYYYPDNGECYYAGMDFVSLRECEPENRFQIIKRLVMYFYAVSVLDDPLYSDEGFETAFVNVFYAARAASFSGFGYRLRDTVRKGRSLGLVSETPQYETIAEEQRTLFWELK